MPSFRTVRRVPFTPQQMFAVVADVESYPKFLPLCEALTVVERKEKQGGGAELTATMSVGYGSITEKFTTDVLLDPAAGLIRVRHRDGPFAHLENEWRFVAGDGGCDVQFFIDLHVSVDDAADDGGRRVR